MPELNDLFAAPLESAHRAPSNVDRFPTIGAHLIDGRTPAYAPTEPPEAEPAHGSADPVGDDQAQRTSSWGGLDECDAEDGRRPGRFSQFAPVVSLAWLAAGYIWEEHKPTIIAAIAVVAGVCIVIAAA